MAIEELPPIQQYYTPLRPVITIRDKSNDPTYLFHDSFHPPEPSSGSPSVYYAEVDLEYGAAGTFTLRINDPEGQLDATKIGLGNKVWIQAGRTEDRLFNLFSGVCRRIQPIRANYGLLGYVMTGMGTQIIMNERIVNFLRQSLRNPSNPNKPFIDDPNMKANKLFKDLMISNAHIPLVYPAIKHTLHPGMYNTDEQIDPLVDTFIASLTEPYVEASQVANSIADMAGAIWGVSPGSPNQPDKVFLRFPSTLHSGTIIKDRPEDAFEYINKNVSYLRAAQGGWSYSDSMLKEDGFTNNIFSKTGTDLQSGSTSTGEENMTVATVDIGQQFTVNSTQLRDLAITVSIEGKGQNMPNLETPWNPLRSRFNIVNDAGGRPGSIVELSLSFDLLLENGPATALFLKLPQAHRLQTLKPGDKAWLLMQEETVWTNETLEETCAHPEDGFAVRWHHDGGNTGISAIRTVCYRHPALGGGRTPLFSDTTSGWVINNAGPTYAHTFFDSFSHIVQASDQDSINKYGPVDSFIDASWITDENTMNQYLSSILQYSAKPRRIYEMAEVFIPYNKMLEPGSLVSVIDTKAGLTPEKHTMAEVQEVRYEFSAESTGRNPLGANTCEVRLLGYVDYREDYLMAVAQQALNLPAPIGGPVPPPPPPPPPPGPEPGTVLDTDGVKILYPMNNAQGKFHRNLINLPNTSGSTWTNSTYFKHDCENNQATKQTSGSLVYWNMVGREGSFQSGGSNWTCRPTWVSDSRSTPAGLSGAKSRGYLATPDDPKNIEFTAICRVHNIKDNDEEATFKWCGDTHSDTNEKTLQGASLFPYRNNETELFHVEITHPSDRRADVSFISPYSSSNMPKINDNTWRGIKTVKWNINNNQGIHVEWWFDENPLSGGAIPNAFNNNWKKFAVYEESNKSDTPTWGGPHNTLRFDMLDNVDLAAFSIHEIIPPTTTGQTASATVLAERAEYEETTGMQHPDYVSEMVEVPAADEDQTRTTSGGITKISNEEGEQMAEATTGTAGAEVPEGSILTPKTIARYSERVPIERDEIDATFGEIDMSGEDP